MNPVPSVINPMPPRTDATAAGVAASELSAEGALEPAETLEASGEGTNALALAQQLQQGHGEPPIAKDLFPLMAGLLAHVLAVDASLVREGMTRRSR